MKKLLLLLFVASLIQLNAQEFEIKTLVIEEGSNASKGTYQSMKPMTVFELEGTATELYNKAINWVNVTYKNPEEVIKGKVDSDYLRLEGFTSNLTKSSTLGMTSYYDVRYTVKLNFKDGRFKYEITKMEYNQPDYGGWFSMMANNEVEYKTANRKGKAKKDGVANFNAIKSYFENLGISIKDYMQKNDASKTKSDEDW
jgi:hypothetical protein